VSKGPHPGHPGPRRVQASLDRLTRALGAPSAAVLETVFSQWAHVVGAGLAAHSRPLSLSGGVLVVAADDPAWGSELRYLSSRLLARIEQVAGMGAVTKMEVRVRPPGRGHAPGDGNTGW
jgi:predicted nucleic acid-binding Zn ribbon protein